MNTLRFSSMCRAFLFVLLAMLTLLTGSSATAATCDTPQIVVSFGHAAGYVMNPGGGYTYQSATPDQIACVVGGSWDGPNFYINSSVVIVGYYTVPKTLPDGTQTTEVQRIVLGKRTVTHDTSQTQGQHGFGVDLAIPWDFIDQNKPTTPARAISFTYTYEVDVAVSDGNTVVGASKESDMSGSHGTSGS